MPLKRVLSLLPSALFAVVLSCGAASKPAESPQAGQKQTNPAPASGTAEAANEPASGVAGSATVPSECHRQGKLCAPDPTFVKRLCNNRYPSMALHLFGNGSKWTRGYLNRRTQAWNASGGASAGGFVEFDEEVLLLFERKADAGGMQVSGAGGSYDGLRWDGSCVTLSGEEISFQKPPAPKAAGIEWRFLDDNVQEALRKDEDVNASYLERRQECKGASSGEVSLKCVKADAKLSAAVVRYVRKGGEVPIPSTLPE